MGNFLRRFGIGCRAGSRADRIAKARQLDGLVIRYVTERRLDNDDVVGRGGAMSVRGREFILFSSGEVLLRTDIANLQSSFLMSGDGVILTAPNEEDGGKMRTLTAHFVYHRK